MGNCGDRVEGEQEESSKWYHYEKNYKSDCFKYMRSIFPEKTTKVACSYPYLSIKSTFCMRNIMATTQPSHMNDNTVELKRFLSVKMRKKRGGKGGMEPGKLGGDRLLWASRNVN